MDAHHHVNLQVGQVTADDCTFCGWFTTGYGGSRFNLQEIEQQFGSYEAWTEWLLGHFEESEQGEVN